VPDYPYSDKYIGPRGYVRETEEPIVLGGETRKGITLQLCFERSSQFISLFRGYVDKLLDRAGEEDAYVWIRKVHIYERSISRILEKAGFKEDDEKMWRAPHSKTGMGGLEVSVYRSEKDGALVVDMTGPGDADLNADTSPAIRVYLNKTILYEGKDYDAKDTDTATGD